MMGSTLTRALATALLTCVALGGCSPASESPTGVFRPSACGQPLDFTARCGLFEVEEDRSIQGGRRVALFVVVLPASGQHPAADPIFFVAGGPGQRASEVANAYANSPLRVERDMVFVDQRGTSISPVLNCRVGGSDADLQGYLEPLFDAPAFAACGDSLGRIADLRRYTTPETIEDFEVVRAALGYDRINLLGVSYGTRVIFQYLRQRPAHIRAAAMVSAAPFGFRNPLYHARSAQDALDSLLAACAEVPACHEAFPAPQADLDSILARLMLQPATVQITDPATGRTVSARLTRDQFAEALRVMMYSATTARSVPRLLHRAADGDYAPFATQALVSNRSLRTQLRLGLLMSVTCSEDVPRIQESEIASLTAGTFLGDSRVRQQIAACAGWPVADMRTDLSGEVASSVPSFVISGRFDPVTPPVWGAVAARALTNGRHVVVDGGHSPMASCTLAMLTEFFREANANAVNVSCAQLTVPSFELTGAGAPSAARPSRARTR